LAAQAASVVIASVTNIRPILLTTSLLLSACGGAPTSGAVESPESSPGPSEPAEEASATEETPPKEAGPEREFALSDSETARAAHGEKESQIKATKSHAALKFIVVDKEKNEPIPGIVISLTGADGAKFYTEETDSTGYAEVLVPVGQNYDLVYLSLGRKDISARVPVAAEPNQNIRLTLRYKNKIPPPRAGFDEGPGFVLDGVNFDTAKATIRPESYPRLDGVVEYMTYKKSAHIRIIGHTDNVGDPAANKRLSERRASACRDYLMKKGIDGSRIETAGYGDQQPIATNDTPEGRQKNRRIEAKEL
jgi:outer membrane protein OmpA-like peptidoglycan-associated protein